MLVTLRRRGESIRIDDEIEITVLDIQRNKVRIGITAPANVRINRSEVVLVKAQNAIASRPPASVEATLLRHLEKVNGRYASSARPFLMSSSSSTRSDDAVGAAPATTATLCGEQRH